MPPATLAAAAHDLAPHQLAFWLRDCAADFHAWLAEQYGDLGTLNAAWGTTYDAITAIQQPPDRYATPGREITPLVAEFERFREDSYIDYLKLIYDSIKSGDPSKPVASRHSSLLTASVASSRPHNDVLAGVRSLFSGFE